MKNEPCLSEDQLYELFYNEEKTEESDRLRAHLQICSKCSLNFNVLNALFRDLDFPVPLGGERAFRTAVKVLELEGKPARKPKVSSAEVFTPEEAAFFLRVPLESVQKLLKDIPHFVFDGHVCIRKSSLERFIRNLEKPTLKREGNNVRSFFLKRDVI